MSLVKSKELFLKGTTFTFSQGAATLYVGGGTEEFTNSGVNISLAEGYSLGVSCLVPPVNAFPSRVPVGGSLLSALGSGKSIMVFQGLVGNGGVIVGFFLEEGASASKFEVIVMSSAGEPLEVVSPTSFAGGSSLSFICSLDPVGHRVVHWLNGVEGSVVTASWITEEGLGALRGEVGTFCIAMLLSPFTVSGLSIYNRVFTSADVSSFHTSMDGLVLRPLWLSVGDPVDNNGMIHIPCMWESSDLTLLSVLGDLLFSGSEGLSLTTSSRDGEWFVWRYSPASSAPIAGLSFYSKTDTGNSTLEVEAAPQGASSAGGSVSVRLEAEDDMSVLPCVITVQQEGVVRALEYRMADGNDGDTLFIQPSSTATLQDLVKAYIVTRSSLSNRVISQEEVPWGVLYVAAGEEAALPANPLVDRTWCRASMEGSPISPTKGYYQVFTSGETVDMVSGYPAMLYGGVRCSVDINVYSAVPYAQGCCEVACMYEGELWLCKRPLYVNRGWRQETKIALSRTDGGSSWVIPASPSPAFARFEVLLTTAESTVAGEDLSLSSVTTETAIRNVKFINPTNIFVSWEVVASSSDSAEFVFNVLGSGTTAVSGGFAVLNFESNSTLPDGFAHKRGARILNVGRNEVVSSSLSVNAGDYTGTIPIGGGSLTPSAPVVRRVSTWSSGSESTENVSYTVTYSENSYMALREGFSVDSVTGKVTVPSLQTFLLQSGQSPIVMVTASVLPDGASSPETAVLSASYTTNTSITASLDTSVEAKYLSCPWTIGKYNKSALVGVSSLAAVWAPEFKVNVKFNVSGVTQSFLLSDLGAPTATAVYGFRAWIGAAWTSSTVTLLAGNASHPALSLSVPSTSSYQPEAIRLNLNGTWGTGSLLWKFAMGMGWRLLLMDAGRSVAALLTGEVDGGRPLAEFDDACAGLFVNGLV